MFDKIMFENQDMRLAQYKKALVAGRAFILTLLISAPAAAQNPCPPQIVSADGESVASEGAVCPGTDAPGSQSQTPEYQDPLAACSGFQSRRVVAVSNARALQDALNSANCGDTIELAAGTYGSNVTLNKSCPANNPIIVKGTANFASVATGRWTLAGARNIVTGIEWNGGRMTCRGNNNKIIGNRFVNTSGSPAIQLQAENAPSTDVACEIAYNLFANPTSACSGTGAFKNAIKAYTDGTGSPETAPRDVWIHHNHFRNWKTDCDQGDLIELGESGTYDWWPGLLTGIYIEDNLIEGFTGGKRASIMDLKMGGGMVIRRNTVRDSGSKRVQSRFAHTSVWESNWLEGGSILHINNKDQIVACNNVTNNIRIQAGNMDVGELGSGYTRSRDVLVTSNKAGELIIGFNYQTGHDIPALRTTVMDHSGKITCGREDNTSGACGDTAKSSPSYQCAAAVQLTGGQVGPAALSRAPTKYLQCRRP
jgi:hypothetical protein